MVEVLEQPGMLASTRSLSAQDPSHPSQTKIPFSPRSQLTQDPSQPKILVSTGCPIWFLAHAIVFGSCEIHIN